MRRAYLAISPILFMVACDSGEHLSRVQSAISAGSATAAELVQYARGASYGSGPGILTSLHIAKTSPTFIRDLCKLATDPIPTEPTAALIPLALLGEAKTPEAVACLRSVMGIPWPTSGTCVGDDPEYRCARIAEQEGLAIVQSKALDGLAYYRSSETDDIVLHVASEHPDRGIRARAALVFAWNHEGDANARATLLSRLRPDEADFANRLIKQRGEPREVFDRKVTDYYGISTVARRGSL